jgi:hypothetical protein
MDPGWRELLLAAECFILGFEPGEGVIKMLRIKVRPIFVSDIKIGIHRLHREETAQAAASSPPHNQIHT